MCGHKQIGIWEVSKITVVDSNDIVNHWLMTGAINIPTIIICGQGHRSEHVIPPPLSNVCTKICMHRVR